MSGCKISLLLISMLLTAACASSRYPTGFPTGNAFPVAQATSCSFDTVKVCDNWAGGHASTRNCVCAATLTY